MLQLSLLCRPRPDRCADKLVRGVTARRIVLLLQEIADYDRQQRASNDVVVSRAGKDGQLRHRPSRSVLSGDPLCATESLVEFNDMLGANGICIGKDQECRFLESLDLR